MKNRYIVTGGIASGKSTVVSKLKKNGIHVIDADKTSYDVFWDCTSEIQRMFDTDLTGKELRTHVGQIVFKDKEKRTELEGLMLPLIREEMEKQATLYKDHPYIYDIPLYFEKTLKQEDDFVILVYVHDDVQLQRLKKRNNLSDEEALDRINSQMSTSEKMKGSDYIIDNSGSIDELEPHIKLVSKLVKYQNKR